MNKKVLALTIVLACAGIPGIVQAVDITKESHCDGISQKSLMGRMLCNGGNTSVPSCTGCHGADGNSMVPMYPKLAGQHSIYLTRQLLAFKDGSRADPSMQSIAVLLNKANMQEIADFYANQKITVNTLPQDESEDDDDWDEEENSEASVSIDELMAIGSHLYRNGNEATEVSACIACHGADGNGNEPAGYPLLASQHADYLIKTLNDFKSGTRTKNSENMMFMIANKMSEQEITAVAYYISMMKTK